MCTVSYVYANNKFILTSSRDEKTTRPKAIEPKHYVVNQKKVIFPKDPQAGGTWFAFSEEGTTLILLNGATEKHLPKNHYKKSRGLIVLEIISSKDAFQYWQQIDLLDIEPFTLILLQHQNLYQLRWNGQEKDTQELDKYKHYVWSSATLYPKDIREQRERWFYDFLKNKRLITSNLMISFHTNTQNKDKENGLIINRNDETVTQNITQVTIHQNQILFKHLNLLEKKEYQDTLLIL